VFNATFSNISAFSGGRSPSTRGEPPTMGKQPVNFITCDYESSAPFFVIYKAGREPTPWLAIGLYELLGNPSHQGPCIYMSLGLILIIYDALFSSRILWRRIMIWETSKPVPLESTHLVHKMWEIPSCVHETSSWDQKTFEYEFCTTKSINQNTLNIGWIVLIDLFWLRIQNYNRNIYDRKAWSY
jgi:hypothetical protein